MSEHKCPYCGDEVAVECIDSGYYAACESAASCGAHGPIVGSTSDALDAFCYRPQPEAQPASRQGGKWHRLAKRVDDAVGVLQEVLTAADIAGQLSLTECAEEAVDKLNIVVVELTDYAAISAADKEGEQ